MVKMRCTKMPMALLLALYDATGIKKGTIALLRSRQFKLVKTTEIRCNMAFWSCNAIGISITWYYCTIVMQCHWHWCHHYGKPLNSIGQSDQMRPYMTYLAMLYHCHWHHVMLMTLLMEPLYFLGHDNWNKVQHDFFIIWHHWFYHHVMPLALSMAPLHSLVQDQNKVQHYFFVIWCHWHWHKHHRIPKALSVIPLHFLG